MILFLLKGIIRDRSRSLFPILIIATGVSITVLIQSWMKGVENDLIHSNAIFQTGHVRIMTASYAENEILLPNDLALMEVDTLLKKLNAEFPQLYWLPRIRFGGLIDIPDENGETRSQGPVFGLAPDLLSPYSKEKEILQLQNAVVRGRLPLHPYEILLSDDLAQKLEVQPGETATLISSTMYGSMAMANFKVVGTIKFGMAAIDRGAIIADLNDIRQVLDMENCAGEIMGYFDNGLYKNQQADIIAGKFNQIFNKKDDEFSPIMVTLKEQNGLGEMLDILNSRLGLIVGIFVVAMFIVLWNAGLMGSLRRYGEIGVRLAMGEEKGHLYRSMLLESFMIGIIGSVIGTMIGLSFAYYLQIHGINMDSVLQKSSLLISNTMRAQVTPLSFVIGFIPGLLATISGSALAGLGIYKRETSQLFKELEV